MRCVAHGPQTFWPTSGTTSHVMVVVDDRVVDVAKAAGDDDASETVRMLVPQTEL